MGDRLWPGDRGRTPGLTRQGRREKGKVRTGEHCPFGGNLCFLSTGLGPWRHGVALPCDLTPPWSSQEQMATGRTRWGLCGLEVRGAGEERVVSRGLSERPRGRSSEGTRPQRAVCLSVTGRGATGQLASSGSLFRWTEEAQERSSEVLGKLGKGAQVPDVSHVAAAAGRAVGVGVGAASSAMRKGKFW